MADTIKFSINRNLMDGEIEMNENTFNGLLKLQSDTNQIIESDITIANGKHLLLQTKAGAANVGMFIGDYTNSGGQTYEQVEVGTETEPLCLNHNSISPTNGENVGKNILVNYKNGSGVQIEDAVAYMSDLAALEARITALENA